MYQLKIGAYKDFEPHTTYIKSDYIPRKGELIKRYLVIYEDENENEIQEYWTLEVLSVIYELYDDKSATPVVYANVLKSVLKDEYIRE